VRQRYGSQGVLKKPTFRFKQKIVTLTRCRQWLPCVHGHDVFA
jgi:hypothetical protein